MGGVAAGRPGGGLDAARLRVSQGLFGCCMFVNICGWMSGREEEEGREGDEVHSVVSRTTSQSVSWPVKSYRRKKDLRV